MHTTQLKVIFLQHAAMSKPWSSRQDKGGLIEKEDPFMKLLEANRARMSQKEVMMPGQGKAGHEGVENSWEIKVEVFF